MKYFSDLQVGDSFPPQTYTITREWVDEDADFKQDDSPWLRDSSPFGGPIATLTITHGDFERFFRANGIAMSGIMPVRTQNEYSGPIMVGSDVTTTCTVVDRYERKGRDFVTLAFETTGPDGTVLIRKRDTFMQMPAVAREAGA